MAGQKYNYDESGSMFNLFLLSFLALALIPTTLSWLWSLSSKSSADKHQASLCKCSACVFRRSRLSVRDSKSSKAKVPWKTIVFVVGWIAFIYVGYRVATTNIDEALWDPWEILGLDEGVADGKIKKAFRTLSLKYHPDKIDGALPQEDKDYAASKYIEISKAYKVLTDEEARQKWEEFGHPDGKQSMTLGIALPTWLVSSSNSSLVLLIYAIIFGIGLPVVVARWWYTSKNLTKDGILHPTMGKFYQELKETSTPRALLDLLTTANEFENIAVDLTSSEALKLTEKVKATLKEVSGETFGRANKFEKLVPWSNKVLLLLYAHLLRVPVEDPQLLEAQESVVEKTVPLVGGLLQIALSRGWLNVVQVVVELGQHLVQAVYFTQSPMQQLPHLNAEILKHFQRGKRNVSSLRALVDMPEAERSTLLKALEPEQIEEVVAVAKRYPSVIIKKVKFYVPGEPAVTPSSLITLKVTLAVEDLDTAAKPENGDAKKKEDEDDEKEEKFEWWNPKPVANVESHAPYFPEKKPPVWWVFLADKRANRVIICGNIRDLDTEKSVKLQFQAPPKQGILQLQLFVKSDTFVGLDMTQEVKLTVHPPDAVPTIEEDEISDPDEDSIAGQMALLRTGGGPVPAGAKPKSKKKRRTVAAAAAAAAAKAAAGGKKPAGGVATSAAAPSKKVQEEDDEDSEDDESDLDDDEEEEDSDEEDDE